MTRVLLVFTTGLLAVATAISPVAAQTWGNLKLRFVYDGDAPDAKPANITADQQFCGKFHVVDESLVVNKENNGIANVVVSLSTGRRGPQPSIHPSYEASSTDAVTLDNSHCRFDPHVVAVRPRQPLTLGNSDAVGHNVNIACLFNPQYNKVIPAGGQDTYQFALEERYPVKVTCNIHPWMAAWILVRNHPYVGISDSDGNLKLANLPAGTWTFQFWQEKAGNLTQLKIPGAKELGKGQYQITVAEGDADLGDVTVPAALFDK